MKDPNIIILDEATSNLDTITEHAFEKTIREFSENITLIIIAHRLSTIKNCDKIYVLSDGYIKEEGTHNELLEEKNLYYSFWKEQI